MSKSSFPADQPFAGEDTGEEQSARESIARMIADWDTAFAEGDAAGMTGHSLPEAAAQEDTRRRWALVMDWTEETTARSTIRRFCLRDGQAVLITDEQRSYCFRRPLPEYAPLGRALLGFCARFVFAERETSRQIWVSTREGWLCQSSRRLSYRLRVRRRKYSSELK